MKDSSKKRIDFSRLLRISGYLLPIKDDEVEDFEKNLEENEENPADWEDPVKILHKGKKYKIDLLESDIDDKAIDDLSMAARDGKKISDEIRKRMDEDRKNSKQ